MKSWFVVDWRDGWRSLRATPAVTTLAVLSLALGIGANSALFSIYNGLMLRSLPVAEPIDSCSRRGFWTNPIWEEIRARQDQIADGAFAWSAERFDLSASGETDPVDGIFASGRMFEVLGVSASADARLRRRRRSARGRRMGRSRSSAMACGSSDSPAPTT